MYDEAVYTILKALTAIGSLAVVFLTPFIKTT